MKGNQSRAEKVKGVRRVLAQHGVDVNQLHLNVYHNSLDLSGNLVKYDGSELVFGEVSNLVKSLVVFGSLSTTLSTWDLTGGEIVKLEARSTEAPQKTENA